MGEGGELTKEQRRQIQQQLDVGKVDRDKMAKLNQLFADGVGAMKARKFDQAIAQLQEAARLAPEQSAVLVNLGDAYAGAGRTKRGSEARAMFEKAVETYEKAIAMKPEDPAYHNNLGRVLAFTGNVERAVEELNKAAELDPPNAARYHFNLGAVMTNSGQVEQATAAFRKATESDPNYADAWYQLGVSLSGEATFDEKSGKIVPVPGTVEAFEKYLELEPEGRYASGAKSLIDSFGAKVQTEYKAKKKRRRRRQ